MAVTQFRYHRLKSYVWCIVDNTSKCQSGWAREISINLTDHFISKASHYDNDIFIGDDEDELLNAALKHNYKHAIIIASGTSLNLSDKLYNLIEEQCNKDFLISGQILNRDDYIFEDSYYELHHQFYIINLAQYKEIGQPAIGKPKKQNFMSTVPTMSDERHKDYAPLEIFPSNEFKNYRYTPHGWNIIDQGLKHNKRLIGLSKSILDNKFYLYYEYDHVFIEKLKKISYYEFFCSHFVNSWNSDALKTDFCYDGPVEQYITVGTGVNWIKNLELINFNINTEIVFVDNNPNVINFMKKLIETWDGNNYTDFFRNNANLDTNNTFVNVDDYVRYTELEWKNFLEKVNDWQNLWNKIRKLKYKFVHIDFMSDYNMDWFSENKKTIFNLSNVFNHIPFIATKSLKYRLFCENQLISRIKEKNTNTYIFTTGRSSDGFLPSNSIREGYANDFELFKITDLKCPPWHQADWTDDITAIL